MSPGADSARICGWRERPLLSIERNWRKMNVNSTMNVVFNDCADPLARSDVSFMQRCSASLDSGWYILGQTHTSRSRAECRAAVMSPVNRVHGPEWIFNGSHRQRRRHNL